MENRRKFRLADVILSVICVVFVAEAAAPVASIGNSQYFWWLFMIAAFLLPYGLIASELGTAFPGDGGLYDWIQTAYPGTRWGARASWYYWINFPLWMASLAVVCPELLEVIFGGRIDPVWSLVIQLAFIWIVTWIAAYPVCDSILILNLSAAIKILLALTVGVLGIVYVSKNGFVNSMEARTFLPSFDLNSLSYISVILFNFLGFEVVCTYADNMQAPRRQIPQAIVESVFSNTDNSFLILLLINLLLLVAGMFMDITPAVLILAPIFLPVVKSFGMDPIHFGIMMVMNLGVGNLTPPVGSSLFSGCQVANMDMEDMVKPLLPFYAAIFIALLLVAYVPWFSMVIPNLVMG